MRKRASNAGIAITTTETAAFRRRKVYRKILEQKYLHLMIFPFVIFVFIFNYIPMAGIVMAFKDFRPSLGIFGSPWVGFKYFEQFFMSGDFLRIMRNTFAMSLLTLAVCFPTPIIFAVLISEVRALRFKKFIQTVSYLPHFISWVVAGNMVLLFLSQEGTFNTILMKLQIIDQPIAYFQNGKYFWVILALSNLWKELGWGTIIYLAAISGIDTQLYDAAYIDGAGRFRRIWHVTMPSITFTIVFLLILSISGILNSGFEQQLIMANTMIWDYADNIDTYTYRYGLAQALYPYGTAVGLFKSVVSFIFLYMANTISKKISGYRIW